MQSDAVPPRYHVATVARASVEDTGEQPYFGVLTKSFSSAVGKTVDLRQGGALQAGAYIQSPR